MADGYYWFLFDKFDALQHACRMYALIDPLAMWVYNAVYDYIFRNKATRQFEFDFCDYPNEKFEALIKKCLNGDRSDQGIINTCKKIFAEYKNNN